MQTYKTYSSTHPRLTFWGAAQTVTGSMHLVEDGDFRLLMDCGKARYGRQRDQAPVEFPFDPRTLSAVVISHAHMDHCGRLPHLVGQGYEGPIFCTPATRDILRVVLSDNARIQEDEARVDRLARNHSIASNSHVTRSLVEQTIAQCVPIPYGASRDVNDTARLEFFDAGHVLGSAITRLTLSHPRRTTRIGFTGDLGRRGLPFLPEFAPVPECDLLISEATYGGRYHNTKEQMLASVRDVVVKTATRAGKVFIPSFSLGRTQLVVHYLQRWMREGKLPELPLYVDSPLARQLLSVHESHADLLVAKSHPKDPPVRYIGSREESQEITRQMGSSIIVASGGMCDGGRILDHLRVHLDDPRSSLALISYQAPDSLGARLLDKSPSVRFHGRTWNKWIDVVQVNGFSGHADHNDLTSFLAPLSDSETKVCLVHAEPDSAEKLRADLHEKGVSDVLIPERGESVEVL